MRVPPAVSASSLSQGLVSQLGGFGRALSGAASVQETQQALASLEQRNQAAIEQIRGEAQVLAKDGPPRPCPRGARATRR